MKNSTLLLALILVAGTAAAEPKLIEQTGSIRDIDEVIGTIAVDVKTGVQLFELKDDVLVREGLVRLQTSALRVGDTVAVRHWEDSDKVDRVEILARTPNGPAIASR